MGDVNERVRNLRAVATEHLPGGGPVLAEGAWLICDRCGIRINLNGPAISSGAMDPRLDQWGNGPEGDLCPECAGP